MLQILTNDMVLKVLCEAWGVLKSLGCFGLTLTGYFRIKWGKARNQVAM